MSEPDIRLHITPEPTDEEAAAVAAAIALLASARQPAASEPPRPRRSAWSHAGRVAAHAASPAAQDARWSTRKRA